MRVELQSLPPSLFHPLRVLRCRHRRKGREGSRRKASAYKSRFVENKNHFGGRIARLRAIDGRSGARLVDLSTPSWKKKKKERKENEAYRGFSNGPDFHRGFRGFDSTPPSSSSFSIPFPSPRAIVSPLFFFFSFFFYEGRSV